MFKYLFGIILSIGILSCTNSPEELFTMDLELDFDVPAGLNSIETHTFIIQDKQSPFEGYLNTFNFEREDVVTIQASQGEIIPRFQNIDYQFIRSVSIWMVSNIDATNRREIFYLDLVKENTGNQVRLLSGISELKSLFEQNDFDFEVKLTFRNFTPTQTENQCKLSFIAFGE